MKRLAAICGLVVLLTAPGAMASVDAPASAAAPAVALAQPGVVERITITDFAFTPARVRGDPGTLIIWSNDSPMWHSVKSSRFASGPIGPNGGQFSHDLWGQGWYSYYCEDHPSMTGVIQVGFLPPMEKPA